MIGLTLLVIAISGLVTTILVNKRIDKLQNVVEYLENDNKQLRTQLGEDYTESTKNFHTLNNKINHPQIVLRPTKNMPVTPIAARTQEYHSMLVLLNFVCHNKIAN